MASRLHLGITLLRNLVLSSVCWAALATAASEPLPRHIVLVFADARPASPGLDVDGYRRLAAFVDPQGQPQATLFDGFLIYGLRTPSGDGLVPDFGKAPIQQADYDWFLGHVLDAGQQAANLEAAVGSLPPKFRETKEIILGMPYPSDTLSNEVRTALVTHFQDEAVRRFAECHFAHVRLNGFYWVQETITGPDVSLVQATAQAIHARSLNFFWIPYFDSDGQADWRADGFDCAMLQPNYAFRNVGPNRLDQAETQRRKLGLSMEMEIARYTRNRPESPAWKDSFLKYLSAGLAHHWDKLGCVSYYNGNDFVKMSRRPPDYPYYKLIHKFTSHTLKPEDLHRLAADAAAETAAPDKTVVHP